MYPTMVKVAISATMDVLVKKKFVRRCTLEDITGGVDVGVNEGFKSNDVGYSAENSRSNPISRSSSSSTSTGADDINIFDPMVTHIERF